MATQSPKWYTVSFFPMMVATAMHVLPSDSVKIPAITIKFSSHKPAVGVVGTRLGFKKLATSVSKSSRSVPCASRRAKN
eukprot:4586855-Pyramimonas_sp.AAC.1